MTTRITEEQVRLYLANSLEAQGTRIRYAGLTTQEIRNLRHAQECKICGKQSQLVLDHNHRTGLVRGAICKACNRSLVSYETHLTEWDFKPKEALFQELAMLLNRPLETKR